MNGTGTGSSLSLFHSLRDGGGPAADALFHRYFGRLRAFVKSRLPSRFAARFDPEDVVMSVYRSFFAGARRRRFVLSRSGDLWRLLASIAKHKTLRQIRRHTAARRAVDAEDRIERIDLVRDRRSTGADTDGDGIERLAPGLRPFERRVMELLATGADRSEISEETGRSDRSVRRALARLRTALAARKDDGGASAASLAIGVGAPAVPRLSHDEFTPRRMIGAGRMGKVYEAWWKAEDRAAAVKFLRKPLLDHPEIVRRFAFEAATLAGLRHPDIVEIQGWGLTPGGSCFIVMELVPGPNLAELACSRPVSISEAVRWGIAVCDALTAAHAEGIVHCDLKPANLLMDGSGGVKVADFGLARRTLAASRRANGIEGTAPFMAPEQASRRWGRIGERTDVYGVGATLFALLTGRPPWIGQGPAAILDGVISDAPAVSAGGLRPDLPPRLVEFCARCLSKAARDRYATAREARAALIDVARDIGGTVVDGVRPAGSPTAPRMAPRRPPC